MYQIKTHYSPVALKEQWEEMEATSVYQTYWVQYELWKTMPVYGVLNRYIPIYYEVLENNKTLMIVPLCRYINENNYCVLGMLNGFQLYDIVYSAELDQSKIDEMVLFLFQTIRAKSVRIACLSEKAVLFKSLENLERNGFQCINKERHENVLISADKGYDDYYAMLSKHTRQNLRTAYNRVGKDGLSLRLEVVVGKPVDRRLLGQLIDIYCRRHESRYDVKTSPLKKVYLKNFDFSTRCLQNSKYNFYAMLYIGEEIAAFMAGLCNSDQQSIIIPRLSINDRFLKYSPGIVMINESIKHMTNELGIHQLDLSKGAEQYKLSMGGVCYPTYSMELI